MAIFNVGGVLPSNLCEITLITSDRDGGTVSGGGIASKDMTVTVEAKTNEGYAFNGLEENGETVCPDNAYTFLVEEDRFLHANFCAQLYEAGRDWWLTTLPHTGRWYGPAYGDGIFVAVEYRTNQSAWSTDGRTWVAATITTSSAWQCVTYGNGIFVALALGTLAAWSEDGKTWAEVTLPFYNYWESITYGNGKFVAVAGGLNNNRAIWSADGKTWKEAALPFSVMWHDIAYGNGIFVAVGDENRAAWSTDGETWVATTLPGSEGWSGITYGGGKFVAIERDEAAWSIDGKTWTAVLLPKSKFWCDVVYGGGKFVAMNSGGEFAWSTDGETWTLANELSLPGSWSGLAYGDDIFVAVCTDGDKAAYSFTGSDEPEV